ncbi:MAG: lmo0937 family membrane protein [Tepidiformaceae bacterium]
MNLSLIGAVALLGAWVGGLAVTQPTSGWIHVLLAGAVILIARRIIVGAPTFLS